MKIIAGIAGLPDGVRLVATLGVFDGVHRGHERVLRDTVMAARRLAAQPLALTFDPHPELVLRGSCPPLLCDPAERLAHFARLGIQLAVVEPFDHDLADLSAADFIDRLAAGRQLAGIVMTSESAFGRNRGGTLAAIERLGGQRGFEVVRAADVQFGGARLSSSRIRAELAAGRLAAVRRMLGRPYAVVGDVVLGDRRGRRLGFPTANLELADAVALPPDGIYAARAGWGGDDVLAPARTAAGVVSLGVRPTFGAGARTFEIHLFDFDGDLYGARLRVGLIRRQRGERRFADAQALVEQMNRDALRAREILGH
jgi:riboflavin kinase/FMN adenylyltransferase